MTLFARFSLCRLCAALFLFSVFTLTAQAQLKPIALEKAIAIGNVENFFMQNYRDMTMRKSLEWGDVQTDDKGNRTIRYRYEALIWDKDRSIFCDDFTFDKDWKFVKTERVKGFPKPVEKPDVTTLKGVQKLVEKFFSQNFRDTTSRKTLLWRQLEKLDDGSVALVYRYEAVIGGKETIVDERRFVFDKEGEFVSCDHTEGFPITDNTTVDRQLNESHFKIKTVRNGAVETFSMGLHVKIRKADAAKFDKRYKECTNEVIDQVTIVLMASSVEERKEPTLTSLKEKVKRAVNEVLGTPWIQDVLCSDVSFEVQ
jgi:hypothetical protein